MYDKAKRLIEEAKKIIIIQAENPDGDSLGSALALEEILSDIGKEAVLYCPIEIPKYLRYINGWDRTDYHFDTAADLAIIVDTMADVLLTKTLASPGVRHFLDTHPVIAIDHHDSGSNLSFEHTQILEDAVATGEIIYRISNELGWKINARAAENLLTAIMSDSLGFVTQNVTANTFKISGELVGLGANVYEIEKRRHEYMKKSPEILKYKGELIERIEYFLNGKIALIHIPWEDIQKYSDKYNPSALVLEEMRFVEDVEIGIAIKTYPDGKLTGKLRSNSPISATVAGYFGGGGHEYAAGFRVYETIDKIIPELINAIDKTLKEQSHDS